MTMGEHSSRLNILDALKRRYAPCLSMPPSRPDSTDRRRRYFTPLRVYGNRKVDDAASSFSKLLADQQIIKEKITRALSDMSFRVPHVLVQFWLPITVRKQCLLTTLDQPFGLGVVDEALYSYRLESEERKFVVDVEHRENFGSPGRVYSQKLPEWSLDVHTLPARHPAQYNTHGYITLPVFEPDSGCCVGVLEVITSSNCVDYTFEVQEVSRALKEENLKSPNVFEDYSFYTQVADAGKENELDEIFFALKMICNFQNIPLAQTWALCGHSSAVAGSGNLVKSCSSFNRHCIGKVCMSTYGLPFYIRDLTMWGFHEACRERHLDKSHGVVGRSLSSCGICICEDVTKLGEDEYPLGSYARDNGITSCLAIYLKSIERDVEYVIEFVLPSHNTNEAYLQSLVKTLKLHIKNVSSVKFGNMSSPLVIGGDTHDWNLKSPSPSPITLSTETEEVLPEPVNRQVLVENELIDVNDVTVSEVQHVEHKEDDQLENAAAGTSPSFSPCLDVGIEDVDNDKGKRGRKNYKDKSKKPSKKRKTSESESDISFSLEEISKHYVLPLEKAAVKLNVSKDKLRRICRGHGITRWPYRINKRELLLKSNQIDAVIHTSEGAPHPLLGTSSEPLGPTNITCVPVTLTEHGKQSSTLIPKKLEETTLPDRSAQPETTIRERQYIEIKATYEDDTVRFPFMVSDGFLKLEEEVATRFKLDPGSLRLKYKDKDDDMILVACDSDLMTSVVDSRRSDDQIVIKLVVIPTGE